MDCGQQVIQLTDSITIKYTGDINNPMFNAKHVMCDILGYNKLSNLKWFQKEIQNDETYCNLEAGVKCALTEQGVYACFMLSKQQKGKEFRKIIANYLKQQRLQMMEQYQHQLQQLQQDKEQLQIQYNNTLKTGYIYGWYHKLYDCFDYIGMTTNDIKQRTQQHIQSAQNKQELPFYKSLCVQSTLYYEVKELEQVKYMDQQELLDREKYWQQCYNSTFNQKIYKINNKEYKSLQSFEKARYKFYVQIQTV